MSTMFGSPLMLTAPASATKRATACGSVELPSQRPGPRPESVRGACILEDVVGGLGPSLPSRASNFGNRCAKFGGLSKTRRPRPPKLKSGSRSRQQAHENITEQLRESEERNH